MASGEWKKSGTDTTHSYDESTYRNDETIHTTASNNAAEYTSDSNAEETFSILEQNSLDRETKWSLDGNTWIAISGTETEKSSTEEESTSVAKSTYQETGVPIQTNIDENTRESIRSEYEWERELVDHAWVVVGGTMLAKNSGKNTKDTKISFGEYERTVDGTKIKGQRGEIQRDYEEFNYDSSSTIVDGNWQLESGDGFYSSGTEMGDFAEGEGEYTKNGTISGHEWSYSGTISESMKEMSGGGTRIDYHVNDNEWAVKDEWETERNTFEYEYSDIASGTNNGSVSVSSNLGTRSQTLEFDVTSDGRGNHVQIYHSIPGVSVASGVSGFSGVGSYEKESHLKISDEKEVRTKTDANGNLETEGTRKIAEMNSTYESFSGEKDLSVYASGTTHQGTLTAEKIIDEIFERYSDYEWIFSDNTEDYESVINEYQEKNASQSVEFSASDYYFAGSDDLYSEVDNETKTSKLVEYVFDDGQNSQGSVAVTENIEREQNFRYDFTQNVEMSNTHDKDDIREVVAEYAVSEEKTLTSESQKEESGSATKTSGGNWIASTKSVIDQWNTETLVGHGTRNYRVEYSGTGEYPPPEHRNEYCFSLVEWDLTDKYKDTYEYSHEKDSRNDNNPELENYVTGTMTSDGQATSFHCWDTYWKGYPEPLDGYNETINTAGFYGGAFSYNRPTPGLPGISSGHAVMSVDQAISVTSNYATWAGVTIPGFDFPSESDTSGGMFSVPDEVTREVKNESDTNQNLARIVELSLLASLRANMDDTPYCRIWKQFSADVKIEIDAETGQKIAIVSIFQTRWSETTLPYSEKIHHTPKKIITLGTFKMNIGDGGLPGKEIIDLAKYLIGVMKANPSLKTTGEILHLRANMTRPEVRERFFETTIHSHTNEEPCECQYALSEIVTTWKELKNNLSVEAIRIMLEIEKIAKGTINSAFAWSNTIPKSGDRDVEGRSKLH